MKKEELIESRVTSSHVFVRMADKSCLSLCQDKFDVRMKSELDVKV